MSIHQGTIKIELERGIRVEYKYFIANHRGGYAIEVIRVTIERESKKIADHIMKYIILLSDRVGNLTAELVHFQP